MGIFEAEVRRHTGDEDALTSRVFGVLEILDRSHFLGALLGECGVDVAGGGIDLDGLEFRYWHTTGKRTPDVVLVDGRTQVSVESKLGSVATTLQLVEEYEDGVQSGKDCWLIAVTANFCEPPQIQEARKLLAEKGHQDARVRWVNWQRIYRVLRNNAAKGNATEQKLISDVLALLEVKGLSVFDRFDLARLDSIANLWAEMPEFLEGFSALLGTLSGRLAEKNITCIEPGYVQEIVQLGSLRMPIRDFARWLPRRIAMRAWDNGWNEKRSEQGFLVYVRLNPFELEAGYRLNVSGVNRPLGLWLGEVASKHDLRQNLSGIDGCSVSYYGPDYELQERVMVVGPDEDIFGQNKIGGATSVVLGRVFDAAQMASTMLVEEIEGCLVMLRDVVSACGLYLDRNATAERLVLEQSSGATDSDELDVELSE